MSATPIVSGSSVVLTVAEMAALESSNLYDLLPYAAIEASGCPTAVLKQALRLAGRDFCRDTEIWRETLTILSAADVAEYDLQNAHGEQATILRVFGLTLDGSEQATDDFTFSAEGCLEFDTAPSEDDDEIVADVVLIPRMDATVYPAWLLADWGQAITALALARLKAMSGKPWSDPNGAQWKMQEYTVRCGDAKLAVLTGRQTGDMELRQREWV